MTRGLWRRTALGIGLLVAVAFCVAAASSSGASSATTGRSKITILNRIVDVNTTVGLKGRFVLSLSQTRFDSGTSTTLPNTGGERSVAGQQQEPIVGTNVLHSKKGTLSLSFSGVTMPISTLKPGVYA